MARSLTRMSLSILALATGLTALGAGVAKAQFYRDDEGYGPPVYRGYGYQGYDEQRPMGLRPRQVMRILAEQGYRPTGQIFRNGDVFVVNVIDSDGMQQRVIVDAYQGDILQTHGIARPMPPEDIPGAPRQSDNADEPQPRMAIPAPTVGNNSEERQQRLAVPAPRAAKLGPPAGPMPSTGAAKPRMSEKEELAKSVLSPIAPQKPSVKPMPAPKPIAPKPPAGSEAKAKVPTVTPPAPVAATPPVAAPQPAPTPAPVAAPAPARVEAPTAPPQAAETAPPAPASAPVAATPPPAATSAPAKQEPPKQAPGPLTDVPVAPLE